MSFGLGLLRCWRLDISWFEMVGQCRCYVLILRVVCFLWSYCIHIENTLGM